MSGTDTKDDAQESLASCPGVALGIYRHWKGGFYIVYSLSIDEVSMQPLVHYYSCKKKTRWTRTRAVFTSEAEESTVRAARFRYVRPAGWQELAKAAGLDELLEGLQHLAAGQRFLDDVLVELPPPHEKDAERTE